MKTSHHVPCPRCGGTGTIVDTDDPSGYITAKRQELKLSITELSKLMGVHFSYLSRVESGSRRASPKFMVSFEKALKKAENKAEKKK